MFAKLLKHEFRAVSKPLLLMSAGCFIAGILGGLLILSLISNIQNDNPFIALFSVLLLFGVVFIMIAYAIGSSILLYYRFYKHKFSDQGYLTFTLPASTHQILLSSYLNNLICVLIIYLTLFLSYLAIFIPPIYYSMNNSAGNFTDFYYFLLQDMEYIYGDSYLVLFIISAISSLCYSIILPMLAITIGSIVAKKHKILAAVGIGYGISVAVSMVSGIISIAEATLLNSMNTQINLSLSLIVPAILMLAIAIGGYFLMHYFIDKKLNL